jgi:hypothetical protein
MRGVFAIAARLADAQHGRVTRAQLLDAGVDAKRIERWLADGRLRRVHIGVYAVGHRAPSVPATYMAAVLACGDGATLGHAPAAHLLRLIRGEPPPPEVTVPTTAHRRRPGIVIHRVRMLPERDVSELHGIPITTVPRTLLDLAPRLAPPALARACHEAWVHHRVGPRDVAACVARNPLKPGAAKLRAALGADVTLSGLEEGFLALLRAHGLPPPRTNIDLRGDKIDCHWPRHDLTIELLSYRFHATRAAFEDDVARRRRSNHVAYTYGDVFERSAATIADVARRLAAA